MAREDTVWKFAQEAGYSPLENRCIIVKFAPGNLSDKVASFFRTDFYVIQLCKTEMILLPFDPLWTNLKKDVSLVLPYQEIQTVTLADELFNTIITIQTATDTIRFLTQQGELSDWRSSGLYATQFLGGVKNWHKENLPGTLQALAALNQSKP